MNILIDAVGNKSGGGAIVLQEILSALEHTSFFDKAVVLSSPKVLRQYDINYSSRIVFIDVPDAEGSIGRIHWALSGLGRQAKRIPCDVLLGLNGIGSRGKLPCVIFIQQSLPYFREALKCYGFNFRMRMAAIKYFHSRFAKNANHIFVQSDVIKKTLIEVLGAKQERITAFTPGSPPLPESFELPDKLRELLAASNNRPVVLFVGNDSAHKNLRIIPQALSIIPQDKRPVCWITVNSKNPICRENDIFGIGVLSRTDLRHYYKCARVLIMPSLAETVGFPMLEAMQIGTPVLAADLPYAHAICEDAALFFDPKSPADCSAKLLQLIENQRLKRELIISGYRIINKRAAEKPYEAMLRKLREIVDAGS